MDFPGVWAELLTKVSTADRGMAVVRYVPTGCAQKELAVLDCSAAGSYGYVPLLRADVTWVTGSEQASAYFPLWVAELDAQFEAGRSRRVDWVQAGAWQLTPRGVVALDAEPCKQATHVVQALYVGAYAYKDGEYSALKAEAGVLGFGAHGAVASDRASWHLEGDASACWQQADRAGGAGRCVPLLAVLRLVAEVKAAPVVDGAQPCPAEAQPGAALRCPPGTKPIAGGTFWMGSRPGAPGAQPDEYPLHEVELDGFCLDETEVTVAAYKECVQAKKCKVPGAAGFCNWKVDGGEQHPVNCTSWEQARTYCEKWAGGRLPTEAEWEYAARSVPGSQELREYPWEKRGGSAGSKPDVPSSVCYCRGRHLAPRWPSCKPSEARDVFGLADMAGNVGEWVADWYGPYPGSRVKNPLVAARPAKDKGRVIRGGSCESDVAFLRGAARFHLPAWEDAGFRCARTPGR